MVRPGHADEVLPALARHLAARDDWDLLLLPALPDAEAVPVSSALSQAGLSVHVEPCAMTLFGLEPLPWPQFTKSHSTRFRKRLRNMDEALADGEHELRRRSAIAHLHLEHRAIIDALAKGDAARAIAVMDQHLEAVASRALIVARPNKSRDIKDILAGYAEAEGEKGNGARR